MFALLCALCFASAWSEAIRISDIKAVNKTLIFEADEVIIMKRDVRALADEIDQLQLEIDKLTSDIQTFTPKIGPTGLEGDKVTQSLCDIASSYKLLVHFSVFYFL